MRIPVWMVALAAAAMVGSGVGCSGGGDDDDDDDDGSSLSTGTYTISNATTGTDECDFGDISTLEGGELDVTVTATTVSIDGLFSSTAEHDLVGTSFEYVNNGTSQYDWTDPAVWQAEGLSGPYNCVENDTYDYSGDINSATSFTYTFVGSPGTELEFAL